MKAWLRVLLALLCVLLSPLLFEFLMTVHTKRQHYILSKQNGCSTSYDRGGARSPSVWVLMRDGTVKTFSSTKPIKWHATADSESVLVRDRPSAPSCKHWPFEERFRDTKITLDTGESLEDSEAFCLQHWFDVLSGTYPCVQQRANEL